MQLGVDMGRRRQGRGPKRKRTEGHFTGTQESQNSLPDNQSAEENTKKKAIRSIPAGEKASSTRKKIAVFMASPAVISGFAGAVPQITINAVQQALHALSGQTSRPGELASGGAYIFAGEWQNHVNSNDAAKAVAEQMATNVVNIALRRAGYLDCSPEGKRHYIQWILAGNMTPRQVASVLAENSPTVQQLDDLTRIMIEDKRLSGQPKGEVVPKGGVQPKAEPGRKIPFIRGKFDSPSVGFKKNGRDHDS